MCRQAKVLLKVAAFFCSAFLGSTLVVSSVSAQGIDRIPNIQRGDPGTLLASPATEPVLGEMGRLSIISALGPYVITIPQGSGSELPDVIQHLQTEAWDFSDPTNPQRVNIPLGTSGGPGGHHATMRAYNPITGNLELYLGVGGELSAEVDPASGSLSVGVWGANHGGDKVYYDEVKGGAFHPWSSTVWWSYGNLEGNAQLTLDGELRANWDHRGITGVTGMPNFMGNLLIYASDQSNTGMATYDISDPDNPILLDVLSADNSADLVHPTNGDAPHLPGGYWHEISGHYMVFASRANDTTTLGGGITVVDFSDPSDLRVHCYIDIDNDPMYVNFQDNYAFVDSYKVDIEACEIAVDFDEYGNSTEMSQYALPLGNILLAGGMDTGPSPATNENGMSVWVHQSEPDTTPPAVAYHIPQHNQQNYPVFAPVSLHIPETLRLETLQHGVNIMVETVDANPVSVPFDYRLSHTGMLTIDPDAYLASDTTYRVRLTGVQDYMGNTMSDYQFEFSTGSSITPAPTINSFTRTPEGTVDIGSTVSFIVDATGEGALEYRFDDGLGNGFTAWSSATSYSASYASEGSYIARVEVRDINSLVSLATETVVVAPPVGPSLTAVNSHSQLACVPDGDLVWEVNPDNNTVNAISKTSLSVVATLDSSLDPRSVVVTDDGNIWVAAFDSGSVDVYEANGDLLSRIHTGYGSAPFGLVASHSGDTLYASLYGSGELVVFDIAARILTDRVDLGPTPRAITITPDDSRVFVTRFISAENQGEIWEVDTASLAVTQTIPLYKHNAADTISNGKGIPNYVSSIVMSADGTRAYYTAKKDNTDKGSLTGPLDLDPDNTVRAMVGVIDLVASSELYDQRVDLDNRESPSSLLLSPAEDYLFVALQGNNEVQALPVDASGHLGIAADRFTTGLAPQGLCIDSNAATTHLYSKDFMGRSVSQIDITEFLRSGATNSPIQTINAVFNEVLEPDVLAGKRIFYNAADPRMSLDSYISCATCHIDGGHDGRNWDFTGRGEGLRNTVSLQGKSGTAHGNVHWSANFDEIQDFEHDIRGPFGGQGFMTQADFDLANTPLNENSSAKAGVSVELDQLASYVASLGMDSIPVSPHRGSDGSITAEAVSGAAVFIIESCSSCHSGDNLTDGQLHDVGTLRRYSGQRLGSTLTGIRTPSLFGLHDTAPYLHDGSAATIEDIFSTVGGTVYQAEDGAINPSSIVSSAVFGNLRRGDGAIGQGVRLGDFSDDAIILGGIDGGTTAGEGIVRLRGMGFDLPEGNSFTLFVNGVQVTNDVISLPAMPIVSGEQSGLIEIVFTGITLSANDENVITIIGNGEDGGALIDDFTVSTADDITNANAHTRVMQLPTTDRDNLVQYLQQLDGRQASLNQVPTAVADTFTMTQDSNLVRSIIELTANDTDPEGDALSLVRVENSVNGSVSFDALTDQFTFTPDIGFVGTASFGYVITDGVNEVTGLVNITINASVPNTSPRGVNDSASTPSNQAFVFSVATLLSNDFDSEHATIQDFDGDTLSVIGLDDPFNGTAILSGDSITFTPTSGFVGAAGFTYYLSDGGPFNSDSGFAHVLIDVTDVNTAPTVTIDTPISGESFDEGSTVTFTASANDAEDGDISAGLSWSSDVDGVMGTGASVNVNNLSVGSHTITATVTDSGSLTGTATAAVTISVPNTPPRGVNDSRSTPSNQALILSATVLLSNDFDSDHATIQGFDGDILSIIGLDDPVNGTVTQDGDVITFTPTLDFVGSAGFTYYLSDGGAFNPDSGFAQVQIDVIEINTAPTVTVSTPASGESFAEGNSISFTGSTSDAEEGEVNASLSWSSDLDGVIGTGVSVNTSSLTVGNHTITATATDSGGLSGSDTISLSITAVGGGLLPSAMAGLDIGTVGAEGSFSYDSSSDSYTVTASGVDIEGTVDSFHYIYTGLSGDIDTQVRVDSIGNSSSWAKSGLMIRGGISESDEYVAVLMTPNNGAMLQSRASESAYGGDNAIASAYGPGDWVRLVRVADVVTAYASTDGQNWVTIGSQTVSFIGDVYVGLAASAVNNNVLNTSVFSHLSSDGGSQNVPPAVTITSPTDGSGFIQGSDVPLTATADDPEDGDIGNNIIWSSSIDGVLATANITALSTTGVHTLIASVADSGGAVGEASIEITINEVSPLFNLTVNSGSGDGAYAVGAVITITADAAPEGQVFSHWLGDVANIADVNASSTTLIVGAADATITASYESSLPNVVNSVRQFTFNHSLWEDGLDTGSAGYWVAEFANASGTDYAWQGRFGQMGDPGVTPPFPQLGSTNNAGVWPDDTDPFSSIDIDNVLIMPPNYGWDTSPLSYFTGRAFDVIDYIVDEGVDGGGQSGIPMYIYEHWPELGNDSPYPLISTEWTDYHEQTKGAYHQWYVDYQNELINLRPDIEFRMIPVGPIIADILQNASLQASNLSFDQLYRDGSPHGRQEIYFLAGLITYQAMFGQQANNTYIVPALTDGNPPLVNDFAALNAFVWARLNHYNNNGVHIWP